MFVETDVAATPQTLMCSLRIRRIFQRVILGLMPEVRDFEPLHALDGEDGLQFTDGLSEK